MIAGKNQKEFENNIGLDTKLNNINIQEKKVISNFKYELKFLYISLSFQILLLVFNSSASMYYLIQKEWLYASISVFFIILSIYYIFRTMKDSISLGKLISTKSILEYIREQIEEQNEQKK